MCHLAALNPLRTHIWWGFTQAHSCSLRDGHPLSRLLTLGPSWAARILHTQCSTKPHFACLHNGHNSFRLLGAGVYLRACT